MPTTTVEYWSLEGTSAAVGRAGLHTVIVDRPEGKAGGMGLGFNGGQLLALALGGCFCNDIQYCADEIGVRVAKLRVKVSLELSGDPLVAVSAQMGVYCDLIDGSNPAALIERAKARCTVAHSLRAGFEVFIAISA